MPDIVQATDTQSVRLEAALSLLKSRPPFSSEFQEYAARLETGRDASYSFADPARREAHNAAVRKGAVVVANATGIGLDKDSADEIYTQISARAALTATWYETLVAIGTETGVPTALVLYTAQNIPLADATAFYEASCPPNRAGEIYRMIYPDAKIDESLFTRIEEALEQGKGEPRPAPARVKVYTNLSPMKPTGSGARKRRK